MMSNLGQGSNSEEGFHERNKIWQCEALGKQISESKIVICGMGGLGWVIGSSLVTLGVRHIVVFDHDVLEANNLNRLWGCSANEVGHYKVSLFKDKAEKINPDIRIETYAEAIPNGRFEEVLQTSDVVFGGLDKPEPRLAIDILSRVSNTIFIDSGTAISAGPADYDGFGQVYMRTQLDGICLVCSGMNQDDLGYRGEGNSAEPSSGVLNSIVGNLAVTQWLNFLQGRTVSSLLALDWNKTIISDLGDTKRRPDCNICGPNPSWKSS